MNPVLLEQLSKDRLERLYLEASLYAAFPRMGWRSCLAFFLRRLATRLEGFPPKDGSQPGFYRAY